MSSLSGRSCRSRSFLFAASLAVVLAWGSSGFCDTIHDASRDGDLAKVRSLLKGDSSLVISKDAELSATPLHWAAANGHMDVARFLLANKAQVNAKNNEGQTPLHIAAANGQVEIAGLLLANGAFVDATDNLNRTPLHLSIIYKQDGVAELLLAHRADPDAWDSKGDSPWFDAILYGSDVIKRHDDAIKRHDDLLRNPDTLVGKLELSMSMPKELPEGEDPRSMSISSRWWLTSGGSRYLVVTQANTISPLSWQVCGQGAAGSLMCGRYSVRGKIALRPQSGHAGKIIAAEIQAVD